MRKAGSSSTPMTGPGKSAIGEKMVTMKMKMKMKMKMIEKRI